MSDKVKSLSVKDVLSGIREFLFLLCESESV